MRRIKWITAGLALLLLFVGGCTRALPSATGAGDWLKEIPIVGEWAAAQDGTLYVHCLDIGQGDAILIEWRGRWTMIDTGDVEHRAQIADYLDRYSVKRLEQLIITHPDGDHLGGAYAVLRHVPVGRVYDNGQEKLNYMYRTYLRTLARTGVKRTTARKDDVIDLDDGATLTLMGPPQPLLTRKAGKADYNNNSVVAMLSYGDFRMLLTGDAEKEEEAWLVENYANRLRATVLKVGHHGSYTSSSADFLRRVRPQIAVISCGRNNSYGFPHKEPMARLNVIETKVYRTDRDGTVTVLTDGKAVAVRKEADG